MMRVECNRVVEHRAQLERLWQLRPRGEQADQRARALQSVHLARQYASR